MRRLFDMKNISIEDIWNELHPAIGQIDILHWHELKKNKIENIYFLGSDYDCSLFEERFSQYGIDYAGKLLVSPNLKVEAILGKHGEPIRKIKSNATVIVVMPDYPSNPLLYESIKNIIDGCDLGRPHVIHEFSSGFALGTEKIIADRSIIEKAYGVLCDEKSKTIFFRTLRNITLPYHWNMDIKEQNYGIRDPKRYPYGGDICDELLINIDSEKYVLHCCSMELKKNDPMIVFTLRHKNAVLFCPNMTTRLRLREFMAMKKNDFDPPLLDSILWNSNGNTTISIMKYSGGTPLIYEKKLHAVETLTVDDISKSLRGKQIGLISLDMGLDYRKALQASCSTVEKDKPFIVIQGFKKINELWETIVWIHTNFVYYDIFLFRYETDNINEGHLIVLKPKGD